MNATPRLLGESCVGVRQAAVLRSLRYARTLLLVLPLLAAGSASPGQTFVDVTASAGIGHTQLASPNAFSSDRMSGGAVAGDFNGDGWVDLFFTRADAPDLLYFNDTAGGFIEGSATAGFTANLSTNGAAAGDVDNDGDLDLYVTTIREDHFLLYINDGSGVFTEEAVSRNAGVDMHPSYSAVRRGNSASFGDYDRDGYLDIHTTDWGHRTDGQGQTLASYSASRLLRNLGAGNAGHFEDKTDFAGVAVHTESTTTGGGNTLQGVYSFSSRFADFDGDGWDDLAVAGDFNTSRLFWNNGDGTFTDGTSTAMVGTDENGMGSAVGDYDGDGDLDWFVTSIYDEADPCGQGASCGWADSGNRLYRNEGGRLFSDQTDTAGVRDGGWGWGAVWFDYDNDGDLDLSMANGIDFNFLNQSFDSEAKFNTEQMKLWRNDNGVFTEVATEEGVTDVRPGKGLLTLDYDNDGDLDLLNVNNSYGPALYRNDSITQHQSNGNVWLKIDTVGTNSNRDGIGARVTIDPDLSIAGDEVFRDVAGGSPYLSQSETTLHFGLGVLEGAIDQVHILWPSGHTQVLNNVSPNQLITITESEASVPEPSSFALLLSSITVSMWRRRENRCCRRGSQLPIPSTTDQSERRDAVG